MLGQDHVDIAKVIEHLAIQFFRDALIKAAVAGFHVEHRNLAALGGNDGQAGVGIAVEQKRIRLFGLKYFIRLGNHFGDGLGCGIACSTQEVIRLANFKVIEKNLIQFEVVVLTRVNQYMINLLIKLGNNAAHLDKFWSRPDQRHDLKHQVAPECIPDSTELSSRLLHQDARCCGRCSRRDRKSPVRPQQKTSCS
ncbi:hypothetical protein D3C80_1086180 [compost metagenome]